jgi:DNA-binding NtrC family response regulator
MTKNVLASWIGHADLLAMGKSLGEPELIARIEAVVKKKVSSETAGDGPIKTLISQRDFNEIHLLTQWPEELNRRFGAWLRLQPVFHPVGEDRLSDPTNYEQVFDVARSELEAVRKKSPDGRLSILLSPGTPTMAAVWVLLGNTLFPANFFQTYKGKVREEKIPFDITLDVFPAFLRNPDAHFQQLGFAAPGEVQGFEQIKGKSKPLMLAVHRAQRVAIRDVAVLLTGESGTGKEMFARAMHRASHRGRDDQRFDNFVALNCAAIPRDLFESELFGHKKGSFTGASDDKRGAFENADKGTLFLDEVGELSLENQAKLLRALQPTSDGGPCIRLIRRIGENKEKRVDVRIIAATNRDLVEAIRSQQFRDDLFYRLRVVQVGLPALRERFKDLEILACDILGRINTEFKRSDVKWEDRRLTAEALTRMRKHHWPGNIRELQNVLTQTAVFSRLPEITPADIDAAIASLKRSTDELVFSRTRGDDFRLRERMAKIEHAFIEDALTESDANQTAAAKLLGISQQALNKKLKTQATLPL